MYSILKMYKKGKEDHNVKFEYFNKLFKMYRNS